MVCITLLLLRTLVCGLDLCIERKSPGVLGTTSLIHLLRITGQNLSASATRGLLQGVTKPFLFPSLLEFDHKGKLGKYFAEGYDKDQVKQDQHAVDKN